MLREKEILSEICRGDLFFRAKIFANSSVSKIYLQNYVLQNYETLLKLLIDKLVI